jgi:tRNA (adenine22-N1)-methyltransferase
MIKLSKRMKAVAAMVTKGNVVADIGTDHGYVPIALIQQKKIPRAIAMDINKGPLKHATEHIAMCQLEDYIETRLSDGVEGLKAKEADTILIAGMVSKKRNIFALFADWYCRNRLDGKFGLCGVQKI